MIHLSDDDRRQVLGEVLNDQLQAILEYVKDIPDIKQRLSSLEGRMTSIEDKMNMHEADILYIRRKVA